MCGNLLLPRASPLRSHLRGTDFGSAVAQGGVLLALWIPACAGMTWVWSAPAAWDDRLACYGFVGASSYLSASEPYSYNGLS